VSNKNMKLDVLIVDDDASMQDYVKSCLTTLGQVERISVAKTVQEGIAAIDAYRPNLVFLDVELPDGLGFDILENISHKAFSVIFITAHDKYAIDAIRVAAIDYLLKPFSHADILKSIYRLQNTNRNNFNVLVENLNQESLQENRIGISSGIEIHYIKINEILRCEANGNYTIFHLIDKKEKVSSKPIKEYEDLLKSYSFIRIHKTYLVNLFHIKSYIRTGGGIITMTDDSQMPISKSRKDYFIECFKKISVS
jgi:two-component system, LytTR family, response regulator